MKCKNCNQIVNGHFCAYCGQSAKVSKINLSNFLSDLSGSIFQVNKGFLYTLSALFVHPGDAIRDYLNGKRKPHFKPIAYAFTLSTLYFLLSRLVDSPTFIDDAVEGFLSASGETGIHTSQLTTLQWFGKNYAYTMLLLLPLYSLSSYLAFLGSGYNYLEHMVLNAYITGQQAIFYIISSILSLVILNEDFLVTATLFISMVYAFFVFWQFFNRQNRLSVIFRSVLTYILSLVLIASILFFVFSMI